MKPLWRFSRIGIVAAAVAFGHAAVTAGGPGAKDEDAAKEDVAPSDLPIANGDVNGDGAINLTDAIYLLNYQFNRGPQPVSFRSPSLSPNLERLDELTPDRHRGATFSSDFDTTNRDFVSFGEHPYFVLEPGYRIVLVGDDEDDEGTATRVDITVLDETEEVGGVTTRVVEERESLIVSDGGAPSIELQEVSYNYVAIDAQSGDLFAFGEKVGKYENGEQVSLEEAWRAGVDGAQPGIILPGHPLVGARFLISVMPDATRDRAEIIATRSQVTIGHREFEDVLVVFESNEESPPQGSLKFYAAGVGIVRDEDLQVVEFGFVDGEPTTSEFDEIEIVLEVNHEEEAQIRFTAEVAEGLAELTIESPDGQRIARLRTLPQRVGTDGEPLGSEEMLVETVEAEFDDLAAAYPEGRYLFHGRGLDGARYSGEAELSHAVLARPYFTTSATDSGTPMLYWDAVPDAESYCVEIENDTLGISLSAEVPGEESCLEVPACWKLPAAEYEVRVGSVGSNGNLSVAESSFHSENP